MGPVLYLPDPGPLLVLIVIMLAVCAKLYWFYKSRNWQTFADALARLGLAIFYLAVFLASTSEFGKLFTADLWRIYARFGLIGMFLIEAVPWIIQMFRSRKP